MEPIKIKLQNPVKHGAEEIRELVFTRPMIAGDLKGVKVTDLTFDDIMLVAGRLLGLPASVIASLSMPDFQRVSEVVTGFFDPGRETGK